MSEFLYGVLSCFGLYIVIALAFMFWMFAATREWHYDIDPLIGESSGDIPSDEDAAELSPARDNISIS